MKIPQKLDESVSMLTSGNDIVDIRFWIGNFRQKINEIISYLEERDNPVKKLEVKSEEENTCYYGCSHGKCKSTWCGSTCSCKVTFPPNWGKVNIDGESFDYRAAGAG